MHLPHPDFLITFQAYDIVFDPTIRFVFAGLCGLLFGEFLSIYLLIKWKIKLNGKLFGLRSLCAIAIGQLSLSIIVDLIVFFGRIPFESLLLVIMSGFTWKMSVTLLFIYPSWLITHHLKTTEKLDVDDIGTKFNPFKL